MATALTLKQAIAAVWQKFMGVIGYADISGIGDGTVKGAIAGLNGKIIKKTYTHVTTDEYGYFDISNLRTDISNGYSVINAYAKDAAVGSDGATTFPIFSVNNKEQVTSYGYMYRFTGGDVTTAKNAINMTVIAVLTKG